VAWLENYLTTLEDVTCMIVSHDSGFLDHVCTHIMHYANRKLKVHKGNLSEFVKVRRARLCWRLCWRLCCCAACAGWPRRRRAGVDDELIISMLILKAARGSCGETTIPLIRDTRCASAPASLPRPHPPAHRPRPLTAPASAPARSKCRRPRPTTAWRQPPSSSTCPSPASWRASSPRTRCARSRPPAFAPACLCPRLPAAAPACAGLHERQPAAAAPAAAAAAA
jgi:hypothetical protein